MSYIGTTYNVGGEHVAVDDRVSLLTNRWFFIIQFEKVKNSKKILKFNKYLLLIALCLSNARQLDHCHNGNCAMLDKTM